MAHPVVLSYPSYLAVDPSNYVWYDTPTGWADPLSAPSLEVLSTNTSRLKNLSPGKYQHLKHLTVSLRVIGQALARDQMTGQVAQLT